MNLWLDTEFNGHRGELISIGLVDEQGDEFYAETYYSATPDPWVKQHVLPLLTGDTISTNVLRFALGSYLCKYSSVHIIADWPADIQLFCELLLHDTPGERMNTGTLTFEIRRDIDSSGSLIPHNAIADARALRLSYLALDPKNRT